VLSVSELTALIREDLRQDPRLTNIWVKGEISDYKKHRASGHLYFTIKDEDALIPAVMFRRHAQAVDFAMEDGLTVMARGEIGIYEKSGRYQIYVEEMEPYGYGQLALKLEQVKRRLEGEGLFAVERKRPLPFWPRRVGIVTARDGAALQDILRVMRSRCTGTEVILVPVLVQGQEAPEDIARGIRNISALGDIDVLIVGRGGGSFQDLFAFNSEEVVRAIAECTIPVISAVGHEVDITLADLVADARAATPTQAAVMAVPDTAALGSALRELTSRLSRSMEANLDRKQMDVDQLRLTRVLSSPEAIVTVKEEILARLLASPVFVRPGDLLQGREDAASQWTQRLGLAGTRATGDREERLKRLSAEMNALSPLAVLSRGYAVVIGRKERVVKSVKELTAGDKIEVMMKDGRFRAVVAGNAGMGEDQGVLFKE
jgi:exodeoxyribonuclease VII large subunit